MSRQLQPVALAIALAFALPLQAAPAKKSAVKPQAAAAAITEIEFSHQLDKAGAERLSALVDRFNSQQKEVVVKLVKAEANGKPTQLNLATSETIANFTANKSSFKPLFQVMKETKETLPASDVSSDLLVGENKAKLTSLPVAFTTPVLFYNKRVFRQAGLDPEKPPRTWHEMQEIAGTLTANGMTCPYTSSWPVWVHIDNMSSRSGVSVADAKGNLEFNGLTQIKHVAMLATWYKAGYFHTFGRGAEADQHFYAGECAMLTSDAWASSSLRDAPGVELGVAPMPYHDDLYGGPRNTLAGGASIWIGGGFKPQDYKAAARFVRFIVAPETQIEVARVGGFLPLTDSARKAMKSKVLRDEEQVMDVAYASLQGKGAASPLRISNLEPVRMILEEELEQVWADKKPAKAALDTAVNRGNAVLSAKPALKKVAAN